MGKIEVPIKLLKKISCELVKNLTDASNSVLINKNCCDEKYVNLLKCQLKDIKLLKQEVDMLILGIDEEYVNKLKNEHDNKLIIKNNVIEN